MIHGIVWSFNAPTSLTHAQVEEVKSGLVHSENRFASIICGRCQLSEADLRALFIKGKTEDTTFAIAKGIIKEVREIKVPKDVPFASISA